MRTVKKKILALMLAAVCSVPSVACAGQTQEVQKMQQQDVVEVEQKDIDLSKKEEVMGEGRQEEVAQKAEENAPLETTTGVARSVVTAVYPEMAKYPETDGISYDEEAYQAWRTSVKAQQPVSLEYQNGIREFYEMTMVEFLKDAGEKNKIYSPLNVYMALALLAETAGGESRMQILDLLHVDSIETLRNNACILWNANYCDDGTVTSLLANSIWLREGLQYNADTLNALAENYYASSFSGTMGSVEYNKMLQNWLNEQTGGLLEEQAGKVEMDSATMFALASTVYFRAKWKNEFFEANNTEEIFHAPSGDMICEYMHQSGVNSYYWGDKFSAISRSLENSGEMLLILPDEGVAVEELLTNQETLDFIDNHAIWENQKRLIVNQSVPKFDVASDYSLIEGLKNLGVLDVFDGEVSNFTPLTTEMNAAVSQATHAARVMIDEEGCQVAAFTVMIACGAARPPEEKVDFVLDRPFLFVINGQDGQPLFVGIVNQPK